MIFKSMMQAQGPRSILVLSNQKNKRAIYPVSEVNNSNVFTNQMFLFSRDTMAMATPGVA